MSPLDAIPILATASHFYCRGNEVANAAIQGKRIRYKTANIAFSLIPLPVIQPYRLKVESYRKPFFGAMPTTTFHGTVGAFTPLVSGSPEYPRPGFPLNVYHFVLSNFFVRVATNVGG